MYKPKCETCDNHVRSGKRCSTCTSRESRAKNPYNYAYSNLKHRAKERDVFFDLTLEEFTQFCVKTEYLTKKGRKIGGYNVDRIVEGKFPGYTLTNLQILDKQKNIKKYYDHVQKKALLSFEVVHDVEDLPF